MVWSGSQKVGVRDLSQKLLELQEENKRLRRAVDELAILNDLSQAISGSIDSEKIMQTIVSRSIRSIGASQGDITLIYENRNDPARTLVRSMVSSDDRTPLHLNQNILGWIQINKKPLLINNPGSDPRFRNIKWEASIHSVLCAPLMVKSGLTGILTLYNKKDGSGFTDHDQRLLSIIASQSAQVVENARLYEEQQVLMKMRQEMELAAKIQKKLLPGEPPVIEGYSVCGKNITAQSVGGDYYDFIRTGNDHWAICLGDVSGKGLPASLLMANTQAILRGQVLYHHAPGLLLKKANQQLYHNTDSDKFVTLFLGILDADSHRLYYSNGGHEYPYMIHPDGTCERLKTGGLPLGMFPDQEYEETAVDLNPGDKLVIFSDGITDNENIKSQAFGEERLSELILDDDRCNGQKLLDRIFESSMDHRNGYEIFDDMTAVVLSREY